MNLDFFYPHNCIVKRATGKVDENYQELFDIIYSGECGYQPSNNAYNAAGVAIFNSPNVILPINSAIFIPDDIIEITVEKNRIIYSKVESFEDVSGDIIGGTTLWLRQAS